MLLEQGYGQQLSGHQLQQQQQQSPPPPPLQRDGSLPHFGGGAEAAPLSEGGPEPVQTHPSDSRRCVRSVYTQTSPERLGSFEDEPGMSHAHEARSSLVTNSKSGGS
jgi:hypothetical protein